MLCQPSVYLTSPHVTRSLPSIFVYCKHWRQRRPVNKARFNLLMQHAANKCWCSVVLSFSLCSLSELLCSYNDEDIYLFDASHRYVHTYTHVCIAHTQPWNGTPAHSTCTHHLHTSPTHITCTHHMHITCTRTHHMHITCKHAQHIQTNAGVFSDVHVQMNARFI